MFTFNPRPAAAVVGLRLMAYDILATSQQRAALYGSASTITWS